MISELGEEFFEGFAFGECWYKLYESVTEGFENEAPYLAVWLHGGDWGNISKRDLQTMQWRMGRRRADTEQAAG
eukprot:s461_g11.t1